MKKNKQEKRQNAVELHPFSSSLDSEFPILSQLHSQDPGSLFLSVDFVMIAARGCLGVFVLGSFSSLEILSIFISGDFSL